MLARRLSQPRQESWVSLDIVVPIWNEEEVLSLLFDRLGAVFSADALRQARIRSVRYVLVDDGSQDRSAEMAAERIRAGAPCLLLRLSRNFGHQNAVSAGLDAATADVVAVIDADLQDPPETILAMVERWRDGFDVIYGERRKRKEGPIRRFGYWSFYRLVAILADIKIPLDSGDFSLMDQSVVGKLRELPEKLRFPRGLRAWVGFRQTGVAYDRPIRQAGRTKYSLARLYRLATDGVISSSIRPLQAAQFFGFSYLVLTLLFGIFAALRPPEIEVPLWAIMVSLLVITGNMVQVFCIYILGAYVGRTYLEAKGRPAYVIMETIGDAAPPKPSEAP
jgi:polyisoprenyl-phosphate glycosyltransferase